MKTIKEISSVKIAISMGVLAISLLIANSAKAQDLASAKQLVVKERHVKTDSVVVLVRDCEKGIATINTIPKNGEVRKVKKQRKIGLKLLTLGLAVSFVYVVQNVVPQQEGM